MPENAADMAPSAATAATVLIVDDITPALQVRLDPPPSLPDEDGMLPTTLTDVVGSSIRNTYKNFHAGERRRIVHKHTKFKQLRISL